MESASSSSLPNPKPQSIYDAFISFRGEDIRRKFVCHLYQALSKIAGVDTFLDVENLDKGMRLKELLRAIEGSQIAIVVFSENYTDSTWCLRELEQIIVCHETRGQRVVPVFYEVDPSHVSQQKGDFGRALKADAQKRYLGEDLEYVLSRWNRVLTKATNFSGWDVSNYRNDAELVEQIVNFVLTKLDYVLSITKFPIGLESHVKKVIGFIGNHSSKVCIIGIWGMGGSGKTTTAKAIYNQIHYSFADKSFIQDIREVCKMGDKGYVHLQEQLLSDILKTEVKIENVEMGKSMIKNKFAGKRALIVLDDLNEFAQLKSLCGNTLWIGKGSVVIITTRNLHLLTTIKVDYVYEMKEMEQNESLELFCGHAFGEAKPREEFSELIKDAIAYCGGLPLALEVLGSYLRGRSPIEWRSVLAKLKVIPNANVQEILRISFDGLCHQMEKAIFLDICCFFIGKDRNYVKEILNGCGVIDADRGITILIECSLIKIKKNKLEMHNLLQDMGREIIRESSIMEPGKRSRLWFHKDVLEVLTKNTGTEAIHGLALTLDFPNRYCFAAHAFEKMKQLKLLQLGHVKLTGDYGCLSKQLRWLYWQGFPLKHIPNNFYLELAIVIDFNRSNLRLAWKEPKVLPWLTILNLSHSKYLTETPDFSKVPRLEKLILKHCPSLCKVHKSIGNLCNLLLINLKGCTNLINLPREIYKLKSLKTLILSGCSKIDKLEEDIVQMESLTTLIAKNTAVKKVPFSILGSKSIEYLFLCGYEGLSQTVFPSIIWSWMSPTASPLSRTHLLCGISSFLVFMIMQVNNDLGDLASILSSILSLLSLHSILVQCEKEFQISQQERTILDAVHGVNLTKLDITPYTTEISNHSLKLYLIGFGSYQEVFNTLSKSITEGLEFGESCTVIFPGDNYPYWIGQTGEGRSVSFTVPKDGRIKGMVLCVVYLSTLENIATECLISVSILNYTKCTIQILKRDAVISSDDAVWQGILSHLEAGDKVEILLVFGHRLVVKKTAVYLMYGKPSEKEIEPPRKPPIEKVYSRKRKTVRISIDIEIESVRKLPVKVYSRKRMNGSNCAVQGC